MSTPRVTRLRWLAAALALLVTAGATLFGIAWRQDRARRWEGPRWDRSRFTLVQSGAPRGGEIWLVPVNPLCPHCASSLARAAVIRGGNARHPALVALIVDTPRHPTRGDGETLRADEVWWDSCEVWRTRWGHRVYGEILRFDASGRYLGTSAPALAARARRSALADLETAKGGDGR